MKLFLIRHGETVDNVAQVYAGIRDSALTNHGILQANRLGKHFACSGLRFTHIFSSDLQRAYKTAEAIRSAQPPHETNITVTQSPTIREQDFGFYEGKPFYARPRDSKKTGKEAHHDQHKHDIAFQDVESKDSMAVRGNSFLDTHLLPMLRSETTLNEHVVAIVSHGIILATLWRCLLRRFLPRTVTIAPGSEIGSNGTMLEYLGGWSNTGYLELQINRAKLPLSKGVKSETSQFESIKPTTNMLVASPTVIEKIEVEASTTDASLVASDAENDQLQAEEAPAASAELVALSGWNMIIQRINGKDHLKGLKRTGGGVGSSQFDEGQMKIETFFKKQKDEAYLYLIEHPAPQPQNRAVGEELQAHGVGSTVLEEKRSPDSRRELHNTLLAQLLNPIDLPSVGHEDIRRS